MDLELYTDAILTHDLPDFHLRAGDVGTIVQRHEVDGRIGYSLEFFDMTGQTVAVVTVTADAVRAPTTDDLPTVRPAAAA